MITKQNLKKVLLNLNYKKIDEFRFEKKFENIDCKIIVDFEKENIIYPKDKGFNTGRNTTCNFSSNENFVVLECVNRLFTKGYRPKDITLEPEWKMGRTLKSGIADILVKGIDGNTLFIIECKTANIEYQKELKNMRSDGGQLFSYWQQERHCKWLILYASDFENERIIYTTESINCCDDENLKNIAKKDENLKIYERAKTVEELFEVWTETYEQSFLGDVLFRNDCIAYQIGVKPLRKRDLIDFSENNKVVNKFEEILRHNNVSDKENAFNRLTALFICKLVDEIKKDDNMEVEFQYKIGTDTIESLQDRLQRLHKEGMYDFMGEEIFYLEDDYADKLVQNYTGQKRMHMIENLKENLRKLKFYTNNDFAFKDVHNEELFYQNGKVLVEVVQLFEKYRITESKHLQILGDLFEQLLNKGFKQNEGQFFTPMPITKFIWKSIPLRKIMEKDGVLEYPKVIDFACGAGHFLTQGYDAVNEFLDNEGIVRIDNWEQDKLYGIEKDYRLARVSKISLFMHGAGKGNIKFGDGLENYDELGIKYDNFDVLVANPPYSVSAFKPHLKLKNNEFELTEYISNNGSEIETLFVERMTQLLKSCGIAAVILPSSILNKTNKSFVKARELVLENFKIRAIVSFGSKTFGATGTNTVIFFLEKFNFPPKQTDLVLDTVEAIFENRDLKSWIDEEVIESYLDKISLDKDMYVKFINREIDYHKWQSNEYFKRYYESFINSTHVKNKRKQSSFKKLNESEQIDLLNGYFYNLYHDLEKEKLKYFSLAFAQDVLVVMSPNGNKEQEEFLGYKWSEGRRKEGIQILNYGGMLFNGDGNDQEDTIADVIKNSFYDEQIYNDKEKYYYYLKLTDMLDFNSNNFYKTINTSKIRVRSLKSGYREYRLGDKDFELMIGNRVVDGDSLLKNNGKYPVYSANVFEEMGRTDEFINKEGLLSFDIPSILWGIDGDWMVNYIEANKPFYPTDHCGVLRVKNKNILPEYLRYALEVEGKFERFSRQNRASTTRIKGISVQIPEKLSEQKKIVDTINQINKSLLEKEKEVEEIETAIKSKFVEMFGDIKCSKKELNSLYVLQLGLTPSRKNPIYWNNGKYKWISVSDMGKYCRFTTNTEDLISELAVNETNIKLVPKNTVIMSFKLTIGRTAITSEDIYTNEAIVSFLPKNNDISSNEYLRLWLSFNDWTYGQINAVKGVTLNKETIGKVQIPIPPKVLQDEFSAFVKEQDKLKFNIMNNDKSKFVEMFGDNNVKVKLCELADEIILGTSPKSEYYNESMDGIRFYQGSKDFGAKYLKESGVWSTDIVKESINGDILISVRAPAGDVNINPFDKICIGRGLAAIRCFDEKLKDFIFNYLLYYKDDIKSHKGIAFDSLSSFELKNIKIIQPEKDKLNEFSAFVKEQDKLKFRICLFE